MPPKIHTRNADPSREEVPAKLSGQRKRRHLPAGIGVAHVREQFPTTPLEDALRAKGAGPGGEDGAAPGTAVVDDIDPAAPERAKIDARLAEIEAERSHLAGKLADEEKRLRARRDAL